MTGKTREQKKEQTQVRTKQKKKTVKEEKLEYSLYNSEIRHTLQSKVEGRM